MLYRKRESKATMREMLRPSRLLCGEDTKLRAGKPATGCSTVREEMLQERTGKEHHPREPRGAEGLVQDSKGQMVNTLWKHYPTGKNGLQAINCKFLQGKRGVSHLVDKGHHHKDQRRQINT